MPLLGSLILGLFSGFASFLSQWLTKKVAIATAAVAAFTGLTLALFGATVGAIEALAATFPDSAAIQVGLWIAVPSNAPVVVAAVLAFDASVAVYRLNVRIVQIAAQAT